MTSTPSAPLKTIALLAAAFACTPAAAQQSVSYEAAWARMKAVSDKLGAAQAAVESGALVQKGMQGLGGPLVSLSAAAVAYNANLSVDLDPLNRRLAQVDQHLPIPLQNLPIPLPLPTLPSRYTFNQSDSFTTSSISAVWPIYAGGVSNATREFVRAQHGEAEADFSQAEHEAATLLAQRYFGAQLAIKASQLRDAALKDIEQHDAAAEKMLKAGVIARVERLQARVVLEDARRNAAKAKSDAELATAALARMLKADGAVVPQTPLFAITQPLEPLDHFIRIALDNHPGLAKVAAKRSQAQSLHDGEEALRKPQVFAFGQSELTTSHPSWVAGVGVRWTLFDAVDRNALSAASLQKVRQAELTDAQARSDIALLVEKNWRNAEQARRNFLAMQASIDLAEEVLKLRRAGVREGTSTTLELIDAELNFAKVKTERAQSAYEFGTALAALLESCGMSDKFSSYIARADVNID
jgi:outer membrane protein TolC